MIDGVFARSVVVGGGVAFAGFGGAAAFDFVVHISCHGGFLVLGRSRTMNRRC